MNMNDLMQKATHTQCKMCQTTQTIAELGIDITEFTDPDEFTQLVEMDCCDDQYPVPIIINKTPLFAGGDPNAEVNDMNLVPADEPYYEYEVNEDLLGLIAESD